MEHEFTVKKIKDWQQVIDWIIELSPYKKCFFLYGDMGVGKTTFVKAFCKFLGIDVATSSPTFSIVNVYSDVEKLTLEKEKTISPTSKIQSPKSKINVCHIDLYRLKSLEEALDIGIEDYLYPDNSTCTFVEWPQIIENLAPLDTVRIKISLLPNSDRKIVILQ